MMKIGCSFRLFNQQSSMAILRHTAGKVGLAVLLTIMGGIAAAQNPTPAAPLPKPESEMTLPDGYLIHQSVDVGGRIAGISGSKAMYDTLVNLQSGPRVQGMTFEMRALPGKKGTLIDSLNAIGAGFGGDPNNFAKLDFSKGKIYEFSGLFRRDRQYFDYDLLGNPNIPGGQSLLGAPTSLITWPQVRQSPVLFNTVRRMTDTNLTLYPLSKVTFRAGYSQNIFQGPSLSPSGYGFAKYNAILQEYQRNSTDDFTGAIDWKPVKGTLLTFEEEIDHYKADSYFTLAPGDFNVQEADVTPAALDDYDSLTPYPSSACTANSIGTTPLLSAPSIGNLPVINPACAVVTNYSRTQPTRILYPTEILRLQSTSIKNVSMNGDFRYTNANMSLPNYNDSYQGLNGKTRALAYTGVASAKREVVAADYGFVWQAAKTVSVSDQVTYSSVHQPGTTTMTSVTTVATPALAGDETINYPTLTTTVVNTATTPPTSTIEGSGAVGVPVPGYFGQSFLVNNLTGTWDATPRTTLSLTYRYGNHTIAQGTPHNAPLATGSTTNGTVNIQENGGIFNAAVRPTNNWDVNGSVEILYDDNAFTPVGPRQTKHYRVHTMYKPKPWATLSGAYNDLERHNNTNDNPATGNLYYGPLDHVDHSRVFSVGAVLMPNEHYGIDFNYAYSDVYAATNICYLTGGTATLPGAAPAPGSVPASATETGNVYANGVCNYNVGHGGAPVLGSWFGRDFMDAPTQYGTVALNLSPIDKIHSNIGYRVSSVNGSQFFNDARAVNGSLVSSYETPYLNLAWTVRKGMIMKAEYNYYGYGEGGVSGAQYCNTSTSASSVVVPCTSLYNPAIPSTVTGLVEPPSGLTAPRNFHANNLTLGVHYEF